MYVYKDGKRYANVPAGYHFTKEFTQNVKLRNHFLT